MSLKTWIQQKEAQIVFNKLFSMINGNKTYIGGIAVILTGVGMMLTSYTQGSGFSQEAWGMIVKGWLVVAARSAAQKVIEAKAVDTVVKLLLVGVFISALAPVRAHAETPSVDPNTPAVVLRIADGFHVLDNGTVATFYDALHGVPLGGTITTPYKKWYTSVDLGLAYPMTKKGQSESNVAAEFIGGLRLHAGELLYDKVPQVKALVDGSPITAGLLKYAALGAFYSRDWSAGLNRIGPYGGFEVKW